MKRIFVEPLDVLMFRSERPFIAIESIVAKMGIITPSIFEGALKSKILFDYCQNFNFSPFELQRSIDEEKNAFENRINELTKENQELKEILEAIGHPTMRGKSQIIVRGIFFSKRDEYKECFAMPRDIVNANRDLVKLEPKEKIKNNIACGCKVHIALSRYLHVEDADGLMTFNELSKYLMGDIPERINKPYFIERRTGIGLKKEKQTEEGKIYTAEYIRLDKEWGFILWYEDQNNILPNEGLIRLGGEGKVAVYNKIDDKTLDFSSLIKKLNEEGKFKLYLGTPSSFDEGWQPPSNLIKSIMGVDDLELISALPGKPVYIGGYDFAFNREKPLKRWVNVGAVYYYKFKGEIKTDVQIPIKILDDNIDMRCGFIGRW